jgi:chemotaxis protein MotB
VAISSRRTRRAGIDIWPGFVDALAQLVMVIVFVLLIFTAGQFYLTDALSGRDAALQRLTQQLNELTDLLALERNANNDLRLNVTQLSTQLQAVNVQRDALTTRVAELAARADDAQARASRSADELAEMQRSVSVDKDKVELQLRQIASLQRDIEALRQVRTELEAKVSDMAAAAQKSTQDLTSARDRSKELEARLATAEERTALAQKEIDARDVRLKQAESTVDQLSAQLAALKEQLQRLASALDISEAKSKEQQVQIADLGHRLNLALASKVEELARFRSEFFGRLRAVLGDRPDIRIVGDRFVFQSEVLFGLASADLTDDAKKQIAPVAAALKEIAVRIPPDINWVLRVDGHTDRRPISTPQFPSNWELSTARAISVVKYLVDQGIPANRLAAAGFGEYQPIDARDDEVSYRRNRRIELKLTER